MNINLQNKNALVCGGSKGIGKAIAIALANLGANITLVARDAGSLSAVISELKKTTDQDHDFLAADFGNLDDLRKKVTGLLTVRSYHILINNTAGPAPGSLIDAELDSFSDAFTKHILCSQALTKMLVPGMQKMGYGRIINVISTSVKEPIDGLGVSNTIRGAMGNWSKTMANELGKFNITVNNLLPGFTNTERLQSLISTKAKAAGLTEQQIADQMKASIPMGRFADPGELAAVAAFLASPAASYVNGINVPVDGGRTRSL